LIEQPGESDVTVPSDRRHEDEARRRDLERRRRQRGTQAVIILALGSGGVVGAIARYAVSLGLPISSNSFPWSTFLINISGSAILGFLLILLIEQFPRGRLARPLLGSGLIGAYTTFSTFEVDTVLLFRAHHLGLGCTYFVASLVAGLAAVWLGTVVARITIRAEHWLQGEM
jgi:CrcB protein